jgi:hypothetical protein
VNLFMAGEVKAKVGGQEVELKVESDFPWDGKVTFRFESSGSFRLALREPGWCHKFALRINGKESPITNEKGYAILDRSWKVGDEVEWIMEMPVEQLVAHPLVKDDAGQAAVRRGPLIYCVEQVDQKEARLDQMVIALGTKFRHEYRPDLLGGLVALTADAMVVEPPDWQGVLYQPVAPRAAVPVTMIPYGFWANREPCPMRVWVPLAPPPAAAHGPESSAEVSLSFVSSNCQPWGINDGIEPRASSEQPRATCHFWPHKGTEEWAEYRWRTPMRVAGVRVYWFDDTGRGECRLPESWKLQAFVDGTWRDVNMKPPPIVPDAWNEVRFTPVVTSALRLVVQLKPGWSAGIHEWQIVLDEDD